MYEIGEAWMGYFEEIDPAKRLEILDGMEEQSGAMMRLCRGFYRERYTDPKKPAHKVDNWLYKFVYFPGMYKRSGRRFGRSALEKEMARSLKELHLEDPEGLEELERTVQMQFLQAALSRVPQHGPQLSGHLPGSLLRQQAAENEVLHRSGAEGPGRRGDVADCQRSARHAGSGGKDGALEGGHPGRTARL